MVSLALDREMEADWSAEEPKLSLVKPEDPAEPEASSGPAERDLSPQMENHQTPGLGGREEQCREGEDEMGSQREAGESHTLENYSDRENWRVGGRADGKKLRKTNSWKTVRFQDPSQTDVVLERDSSGESLFPDYVLEEWKFEELFKAKDWQNITDDCLLRKKVLQPGPPHAPRPTWGQEVTVKLQGFLEDRSVVEKDRKLVFVIGEADVIQGLEECVITMQRDEITLLLAGSQYAYGLLGREPDIPSLAPLLYQLQVEGVQEKRDPLSLPIPDRIRIGNQKRERGNFHFTREEYHMAARAYLMALDVLTTSARDPSEDGLVEVEEEEVHAYRVKCLNNLAATQLRLQQHSEALHTSRDVLCLEPNNVKALFRTGKLLSDQGQYQEAMDLLKKALKLEPATKAIHFELSKLVQRQAGDRPIGEVRTKAMQLLGENVRPFLIPSAKKPPGVSWKLLLGALVVALGSLVTSIVLTARN
ncbi:FKBP prolyl isomerase 16 [Gadus morhua]|uniref:peptidylprolyl isomerase n=1 Tax=Gadus morhua TaxID=8049 RepID=A0A8C5F7V8_GADMO|nr:peptidyl-prolyl cis-trans isomerase FKBP8-like [Gadus morhua]XP_030221614.1 peptidyl-prolyl cis-trans isomerase FKBP8-like [Gadus morhua]